MMLNFFTKRVFNTIEQSNIWYTSIPKKNVHTPVLKVSFKLSGKNTNT